MDKQKPAKEVLKHRIIAGIFLSLHVTNSVLAFSGTQQAPNQPGELPFPVAYFPIFFLGILGSLYYIFNLCFYRWDYSRLGNREVEIPKLSEPLLVASSSYGGVGFLSATIPFLDWRVYPEGLKVKMMFVGEAFVKTEEMKSVSWSRLKHQSKVVRGPLKMPGNVASAVRKLLN